MKKKKVMATAMIAVLSSSIVFSSFAGWQQLDTGRWKYQNGPSGYLTNAWFQDVNGKWYHFDANGEMQTGWFQDVDGKWYYLNADGSLHVGWLKDANNKWYFMSSSGVMQTGLIKIDGKVYYLNPTGELFVGQMEVPGQGVYNFTESGTTNGQPETGNNWTSAGVDLNAVAAEGSSGSDSSDGGSSNRPGRPDKPDKPAAPQDPDAPEDPDEPEDPDGPEDPDEPEDPDGPEDPDEPEEGKIDIELVSEVSEMMAGSERTLTVKVVPEDALIQVQSDNETVLKVMNTGTIITLTGVQAGTATVTVTASAEGYESDVLTFTVTVLEQPQESEDGRMEFNFNTGWMFAKGVGMNNSQSEVKPAEPVVVIPETEKPYETDYVMGDVWQSVSLPHTYNDIDTFDNFMEEEGSHHGERSMYTGTS